MIPHRATSDPVYLSLAQELLWQPHAQQPGLSARHVSGAWSIQGPLDVAALSWSVDQLVRRHDTLRTRFHTTDGDTVQVLVPHDGVLLQVEAAHAGVDLAALVTEAIASVDLERTPLLRIRVLRITDTDHVLVVVLHELVADRMSLGVLTRELSEFYASHDTGQPPVLPALPIQFGDYANWQRLSRDQLTGGVDGYSREGLISASRALNLPMDRARPTSSGHRAGRETVLLSAKIRAGLQRLSRQEAATPHAILLAAFQVLLHRYTGQPDVVVGVSLSGRDRSELDHLIGRFECTRVLCTHFQADATFCAFLRHVQQATHLPWGHHVGAMAFMADGFQDDAGANTTPLLQVRVQFEDVVGHKLWLPGLVVRALPIDDDVVDSDLALIVAEDVHESSHALKYATDLFDVNTVRRMLGYWTALLESIVDNPRHTLSALPLLTSQGRHEATVVWNQSRQIYDTRSCLHELFDMQVERSPESEAVVYEDERVNYASLNRRANRLAHHLIALGAGAESAIGICLERSVEMVVAILAVLKAGGAYVPLDPDYPGQRLKFMVDDANVALVLTARTLTGHLPDVRARRVYLDDDAGEIARQRNDSPRRPVNPENLAYIIYTSGSTGHPKGVMNTHRAVCNRLWWMQEAYALRPTDRVLQKTPFSFDVSVWEFLWPLITGGTLVVARPGGHRDGKYLTQLIEDEQITTLHFVPSMLEVFLEEPRHARCTSVRRVICSGEALSWDLQQRFLAKSSAELDNLYGPTEAAIDVTFWKCDPSSLRETVPIGHPIANTELYILDPEMEPIPLGAVGELYIGGIGLARGYVSRPGLTARSFIPNPFGSDPGGRLYATGDHARFLPDASIEYLGRRDEQVKIRGCRIELPEIESALSAHRKVRETAVLVREDHPGEKRIVAYVVPAGPDTPGARELRAFLSERLPDYMIPAAFVNLDRLPLSSAGKLNRRALAAPETRQHDADGPPQELSPVQQHLVRMWNSVLRTSAVGPDDNFFDLGGHSLLLTQVASRIQATFDIEVPLGDLFDAPTVADMAMIVEERQRALADEAHIAALVRELQQIPAAEAATLLRLAQ